MEVLQDMAQREEMAGSQAEGARRAEGDQEPSPARPDPEVPERPERRKFTAEYKLRILAEADACETHREVGALLRREGLYSSHLSRWRSRQRAGALGALTPRKRGPEPDPVVPFKKRIADLERENERLRKKLTQAETIIDVQSVPRTLERGGDNPNSDAVRKMKAGPSKPACGGRLQTTPSCIR